MNTKTLAEIRMELRKQLPDTAGEDGEKFAELWLKRSGWAYEIVEQSKGTLSNELMAYGGKRPDFLVDTGTEGYLTAIDAKYHATENGKVFRLQDKEIEKYRNLKRFLEDKMPGYNVEVFFMVVPKEHSGRRLVWVCLSEFENGIATRLAGEPATQISLENRLGLWCEIEAG